MSLQHLIAVLLARRVAALLALAAVVAAVAVWTYSRPKQYTATASVLIDVKSPDPVAGMVLQGLTSPSYMLTQVDVIQSLRTAARVASMLELDKSEEWRARWRESTGGRGSFGDWLARMLQKSLDARPSRGSNVVEVSVTSTDPALAAAAANAFVKSYIEITLELRVEPALQYSRFFEAHAGRLRKELEARQGKLSAYLQSKGIIQKDERIDTETARLAELTSQMVALQGTASESESRRAQAQSSADRMAEVLSSPVVVSLKGEVTRLETRLEELNARLGRRHPEVIQTERTLETLRSRLRSEVGRVAGSLSVDDDANRARVEELRQQIEQQRRRVMELGGYRDEAGVLRQDVENAQRAYDAVLARVNQASMESQTAQANASALEQATVPTEPSSPRVRTNLLLGLLAGLVAAVAAVLLREMRDRRLRTLQELTLLTGQPLITIVPAFQPPRGALGLFAAAALRLGLADTPRRAA